MTTRTATKGPQPRAPLTRERVLDAVMAIADTAAFDLDRQRGRRF